MSLETRLQRLETGRGAEPTHEEWLDYMAALKRYDAGKPTAAAGIHPGELDQIIFVRRGVAGEGVAIDPAMRLVSCFAVAS
jgi:hypothetical protein